MILPFKQKEVYLGFAEIGGLLRLVNETLEFEYQVKDTTLGFFDSTVKSCRIPLDLVDSIETKKKWFSVKFEIHFNRIPNLANPFKLEGNHLILSVKKSDLEKAQAFRSKLMYELLERKMDRFDDENQEEKAPFSDRQAPYNSPHRSRTIKQSRTGGLENMLREE